MKYLGDLDNLLYDFKIPFEEFTIFIIAYYLHYAKLTWKVKKESVSIDDNKVLEKAENYLASLGLICSPKGEMKNFYNKLRLTREIFLGLNFRKGSVVEKNLYTIHCQSYIILVIVCYTSYTEWWWELLDREISVTDPKIINEAKVNLTSLGLTSGAHF